MAKETISKAEHAAKQAEKINSTINKIRANKHVGDFMEGKYRGGAMIAGAALGLAKTAMDSDDDTIISTAVNTGVGVGLAYGATRGLEWIAKSDKTGEAIAKGVNIVNDHRVTKEMTEKIFNEFKEKTGFHDVELKYENPIDNLHYSAHNDMTIHAQHPSVGTAGIQFLKTSNDPVYKAAKAIYGENVTHEQILRYIMAHEFGHIDHYKKGIYFDDHESGSVLKDRSEYKKTGAEAHADNFAENLLKDERITVKDVAKDKETIREMKMTRGKAKEIQQAAKEVNGQKKKIALKGNKTTEITVKDVQEIKTLTDSKYALKKQAWIKKRKNFQSKANIVAAIGATAIGIASIMDVSNDLRHKNREDRMVNYEEENLERKKQQRRKDAKKTNYNYVDWGQLPIDLYNERSGHHKMGNSKFQ